MLLLLFQVEESLYGIDTKQVIEIVPAAILRKIPSAPNYVAGVLNYHGAIVPVIDLCRLIHGIPCQICYSTRIMMVNRRDNSASSPDSSHQPYQFGLMAERVTETLTLSDNQLHTTAPMSHTPYLGNLLMTEKGMVQLIQWEALISEPMIALPTHKKDLVNGARLH